MLIPAMSNQGLSGTTVWESFSTLPCDLNSGKRWKPLQSWFLNFHRIFLFR